ncbi:MAG: HDOD domain-containing protein [Candidatus Krumholzibacteriia bacterium]
MHADLQQFVENSGDLATLPTTVLRLLTVLRDPDVSAHDVRSIIEPDPAMTSNLLKLANSAYFGQRRRIRTVQEALVMLGNRATATLAFATSMTPILRRDLEPYGIGRNEFWRHSLLAAAAAAYAVRERGRYTQAGVAFTAGLIHDIGKLLVSTGGGHRGRRALPDLTGADAALERELLGFDHAAAGTALAEQWGLPAELVEPIRRHHDDQLCAGRLADPPRDDDEVVLATSAADLLAHLAASPVPLTSAADVSGAPGGGGFPAGTAGLDAQRRLAALGFAPDIVARFRSDLEAGRTAAAGAVPLPA